MVQYSFTSTETRRLVRTDSPERPPRLSHSSWTMSVSSVVLWLDKGNYPDNSHVVFCPKNRVLLNRYMFGYWIDRLSLCTDTRSMSDASVNSWERWWHSVHEILESTSLSTFIYKPCDISSSVNSWSLFSLIVLEIFLSIELLTQWPTVKLYLAPPPLPRTPSSTATGSQRVDYYYYSHLK